VCGALGEVGRAQLASERADRMDREAGGLRVEIFRMARTNKESAALIGHTPKILIIPLRM